MRAAAVLLAAVAATVPAPLFTLDDPRITESSSLVASQRGPWLWTANDSGDDTRLFAVDLAGRTLAVARVPGRTRDLEDAAAGPDGTLYLADTGDNRAQRVSVTLLRVPEPQVDPARHDVALTTDEPDRFALTYDDGPHDAEALLVHPRTGQVLVVTKGLGDAGVYAAPQPLADGVLRRVGTVPLALATGGAVSPDGRQAVVRTYTDAYVYALAGDDLVAALAGTPRVVPLPPTQQGEAVTVTPDGAALLTSSEGTRAPVHRVELVPAPGGPPQAAPEPGSTGTGGPSRWVRAAPAALVGVVALLLVARLLRRR